MVILIQGFYKMFYLRHACIENYDSLPLVAPRFLYHFPSLFMFRLIFIIIIIIYYYLYLFIYIEYYTLQFSLWLHFVPKYHLLIWAWNDGFINVMYVNFIDH